MAAEEYVQSLARGLEVLRVFDASQPRQTLSEVAANTGLTRATARRFLLTLVELGYVSTDGKLFSLTPRVLDLGFSYLASLSFPEVAQPHLERLSAAVHESTSASVLDGSDIVYVVRVPVQRIMAVTIRVGTRLPVVTASMGRVMLAALSPVERERHLPSVDAWPRPTERSVPDRAALTAELERVREQGWALVDQELEPGLRSLAVPVHGRDGTVIAAINVAANSDGEASAFVERVLPQLQVAAAAIDTDLAQSR